MQRICNSIVLEAEGYEILDDLRSPCHLRLPWYCLNVNSQTKPLASGGYFSSHTSLTGKKRVRVTFTDQHFPNSSTIQMGTPAPSDFSQIHEKFFRGAPHMDSSSWIILTGPLGFNIEVISSENLLYQTEEGLGAPHMCSQIIIALSIQHCDCLWSCCFPALDCEPHDVRDHIFSLYY